MNHCAKGCEGVAKGFAKGFAKALTCKSKGSKGFSNTYAHKEMENQNGPYATAGPRNPFEPFAPQVNPYANPFAHPFATPSHPFGGDR
jgi:hypothetical protein